MKLLCRARQQEQVMEVSVKPSECTASVDLEFFVTSDGIDTLVLDLQGVICSPDELRQRTGGLSNWWDIAYSSESMAGLLITNICACEESSDFLQGCLRAMPAMVQNAYGIKICSAIAPNAALTGITRAALKAVGFTPRVIV